MVGKNWQLRWLMQGILALAPCVVGASFANEPTPAQTQAPPQSPERIEISRLWRDAQQLAEKKMWAGAAERGAAALALQRRQTGGALQTCMMLDAISYWHTRLRAFPSALKAARESADIRTLALGGEHWQTVDAKDSVALIDQLSHLTDDGWRQFMRADQLHLDAMDLQQKGQSSAALKQAEQALSIYTAVLGRERAVSLTCQARVTQCQLELGQYFQAQANIRELIEVQPRLKGMLHPDTLLAVRLLGRFNEAIGDLANAEDASRKVLEISTALVGPNHADTVSASVELAKILSERRKFGEAEPILKSALKQQREKLSNDHPATAQTMKVLGIVYCDQARFADAEPLLVQSVTTFRRTAGDKHLATASALNALGKLYLRTGRFRQAHDSLTESMAICLSTIGDKHPSSARVMDNIADLYEAGANPGMARQLRLQCLKIAEDSFGQMSPLTANALVNLARTYIVLSDHALAEPYLLRAREIRRKMLGEEDPQTAAVVGQLAYVYLGSGDSVRAEPLFLQALVVLEKHPGPDATEAPRLRKRLALLYQSQGKLDQAAAHYRQAMKSLERSAGPASLAVAEIKVGLAQTVLSQGDCRESYRLIDEALRTYDRILNPHDPAWLDALGVAATARLAADDTAEAERLLTRALAISRRCSQTAAAYQSERQRLAQMMVMRHMLDLYLSLPITPRTEGPALYPYVLTWKGAIAARQWRDRQCTTADTAPLDAELQQLRRKLATLTLQVPEPAGRRAWMGQLFALTMRKESLEQQRAVYSAQLQNGNAEVQTSDLQEALAPGTALIDFLLYSHTSFGNRSETGHQPTLELNKRQRCLAFVVRRDRSVVRIDLGEVAPIGDAIAKWRKTRGFRPDPGKTDWAAEVGQRLWPQLQPLVHDCDTLLISPDGILSQLAWNVLPGRAKDRYLIEDFAIATTPVPQLLPAILRAPQAVVQQDAPPPSLLLLGDVDYNARPSGLPATQAAATGLPIPRQAAAANFAPLKGTDDEVRAIDSLFRRQCPTGRATLLVKKEATEEAFWREATHHRWLHVATHGFFAPPNITSAIATQNRMDPDAAQRDGVSLFHVDYLNGLALAGANVGARENGDDGILTAAEMSVMDLRNVDTVVLSGCETGLGEFHGGEGAFGMQRALQIAGVRTTIGSLWTVPDEKTNLLMQRFYSNLWEKKLPRLQALREAQLWMLNTGGQSASQTGAPQPRQRLSPHYWAAFNLSGDWR